MNKKAIIFLASIVAAFLIFSVWIVSRYDRGGQISIFRNKSAAWPDNGKFKFPAVSEKKESRLSEIPKELNRFVRPQPMNFTSAKLSFKNSATGHVIEYDDFSHYTMKQIYESYQASPPKGWQLLTAKHTNNSSAFFEMQSPSKLVALFYDRRGENHIHISIKTLDR